MAVAVVGATLSLIVCEPIREGVEARLCLFGTVFLIGVIGFDCNVVGVRS